jgi:hypothetical protein
MKIADDNHDNIYQFLMSTFETADTSVAIHNIKTWTCLSTQLSQNF